MKAYCLFEQSGTFKNEFIKLGIPAEDYDIRNDYGQTDHQVDLFKAILDCYDYKPSLFDGIGKDDYVMAFFPCTRFENMILLGMRGEGFQMKNWTDIQKCEYAGKLQKEQSTIYEIVNKLAIICMRGGWRMVIENPYSEQHYLRRYWPLKPKLIDKNRHARGDYYKKPTQYWFINFEPKNNMYLRTENTKERRNIVWQEAMDGKNKTICRSEISSEYARRFILEHILDLQEGVYVI